MDFTDLSLRKLWTVKNNKGIDLPPVTARIHWALDANAKYWTFFIPSGIQIRAYVDTIFQMKETHECILGPEGDLIEVEQAWWNFAEEISSATLVFTRRVFLYIDKLISEADRNYIARQAQLAGFHVIIRDQEYAKKRSELEKPLAFISHDYRDKDELVRELARQLLKLLCPVWYDEYSLRVGDSLRESIEKGLKEAKNCIIILSPNFLSNKGWGKAEFDSIYMREILEKKNIMLPVWHNVTREQVYAYSPRLAEKFGLHSSLGVEELARRLARKIKQVDV